MSIDKEKFLQRSRKNKKYRIIEKIGSGKIGNVWKAKAILSDEIVAIKVLHSKNFDLSDVHFERFNREKKYGMSLTHLNLVKILDDGIDDKGFPFLVMEYINGNPLSKVINNITKERRISIAADIISGLKFLHENDLIHRDLKPDNIIITKEKAVICDFGLLKNINDPMYLTLENDKIGSNLYISKHQANNPSKADKLDDIYSLCVCLFEIFTGEFISLSWQKNDFILGNNEFKKIISSVLLENERNDFPTLDVIINVIENIKEENDQVIRIMNVQQEIEVKELDIPKRTTPLANSSGYIVPCVLKWVYIDGGRCQLGTDVEKITHLANIYHLSDMLRQPILRRRVKYYDVSGFKISATCVTNEEYYKFTNDTGWRHPRHWNAKWRNSFNRPFLCDIASQPVVNVSVNDAQGYCHWSKTRLPNWYEWEYAVSGVNRQPYPWGMNYDMKYCNSVESGRGSLAAVDDYPLGNSLKGVRQLCGNAAEWVIGPDGQFEIRGGSYLMPCELWGLAYAFRQVKFCENEYKFGSMDIGFRVVTK